MNSLFRSVPLPRWIFPVAVIGFAVALASPAVPAQTDSDMEILRDKLKADKKLLVAENLRLTEDEAKGFWPIYDAHQQKLDELNERLGRTIESYADAYVDMTLTDEKAKSLMEAALEVEQAEVALKKETLKKLDGVVPAMKAVRYLQLENKIRALIRFDLAANIPLVE